MQIKYNKLKKLKLEKREKKKEMKEERKNRKKIKENSKELQKPNLETQVFNNNKKCEYTHIHP